MKTNTLVIITFLFINLIISSITLLLLFMERYLKADVSISCKNCFHLYIIL